MSRPNSARTLSVVEPHPSVKPSGFIGSGRGGAGNYARYQSSDLSSGPNASGPAARASLLRPSPQRVVPAGRGGAGNMFRPVVNEEPSVFLFDEELVRRREAAPVYHIGRGGAANWVNESGKGRQGSESSGASVSSDRSEGSAVRRSVEGVMGKLGRRFKQ